MCKTVFLRPCRCRSACPTPGCWSGTPAPLVRLQQAAEQPRGAGSADVESAPPAACDRSGTGARACPPQQSNVCENMGASLSSKSAAHLKLSSAQRCPTRRRNRGSDLVLHAGRVPPEPIAALWSISFDCVRAVVEHRQIALRAQHLIMIVCTLMYLSHTIHVDNINNNEQSMLGQMLIPLPVSCSSRRALHAADRRGWVPGGAGVGAALDVVRPRHVGGGFAGAATPPAPRRRIVVLLRRRGLGSCGRKLNKDASRLAIVSSRDVRPGTRCVQPGVEQRLMGTNRNTQARTVSLTRNSSLKSPKAAFMTCPGRWSRMCKNQL